MPRTEPIYQRIIRDIEAQVASRALKPGDRLPSTAEMAEQYACSTPTVKQALVRLEERGIVEGHQGLGRFIRKRVS